MKQTLQNLYSRIKRLHEEIHSVLLAERAALLATTEDTGELADAAYFAKKAEELVKDSRSNIMKFQEEASKKACLLWTRNALQAGTLGESIKTEHCVATPDVAIAVNTPKSGTPEYEAMLEFLGIRRDAAAIVSLHWVRLAEYLSQLAAEGKPMPPGVNAASTYNVYRLSPIRSKKEVDE